MPNSLQEERELRRVQEGRELRQSQSEGRMVLDFDLNQPVQWYRSDGTPLPQLLPADEYHRQLYMSKGWSLSPPKGEVAVKAGPSLIEQELARNQQLTEEKAKGQGLSPVEQELKREIDGQMSKGTEEVTDFLGAAVTEDTPKVGEPCPEPGCDYVAEGKSLRLRKARLELHTYGPRSKHKKEKQD